MNEMKNVKCFSTLRRYFMRQGKYRREYFYNNKKVSKKFWLKKLKQYPGFERKLKIINEKGKYRVWKKEAA